MTNENRDITDAVEFVKEVLRIVRDPRMPEKLKMLEAAVRESVARASGEPQEAQWKAAERGTCPTCGREYAIKENGALRRHGKGRCYTDNQLPQEIIPAVLALAELGNAREESTYGENGGGRE